MVLGDPPAPRASFRSILVVEDDVLVARAYERALAGLGEVAAVTTVSAALAALRNAPPPAVVLVDIGLPDGSGLDVARAASSLEPPPRVVIITGDAAPAHTQAATRLGARVLFKPVALDVVRDVVTRPADARPSVLDAVRAVVGPGVLSAEQEDALVVAVRNPGPTAVGAALGIAPALAEARLEEIRRAAGRPIERLRVQVLSALLRTGSRD